MTENTVSDSNIPTNLRLLLVLEAMAEAGVPVTPTEVNHELGLPKPTIHRLFATLESEGFIQRDIDGRGYAPGRRLRTMSSSVLSSLRIRTARTAILTQVAERIGETCNIAMPDRDEMVYLDRVETKWPLRIQLPIGSRVPFYSTASGKLYLSTLGSKHLKSYARTTEYVANTPSTIISPTVLIEEIERVREHGYSTDNQEFMEGMIAVAVPIKESSGRLVSTLSVHAPIQRLPLIDAVKHVDILNEAAAELSTLIS